MGEDRRINFRITPATPTLHTPGVCTHTGCVQKGGGQEKLSTAQGVSDIPCYAIIEKLNKALNLLTYAKQQLQKFQTKDSDILNIIAADTPHCSGFQFQFGYAVILNVTVPLTMTGSPSLLSPA